MADYTYITETGVILPDTSELLETVRDEYRQALGVDLDVSPETPQGVLITGEVLARDEVLRNNAALANQINPNLAGGVFLDAIWALTGGGRVKATRTLVRNVLLTGRPGISVPEGARAMTIAEDVFELTGSVTLNSIGQAYGVFQSLEFGPIAAQANELNQIQTVVLGWETVNNPTGGEVGSSAESDQAARLRRRRTLALQGVALPEAIISALYDTPGVKSLTFRENVGNTNLVIAPITLVPHSIYVCVDGGRDLDIATTLLQNKSLGAGWNGAIIVPVIEPISGQAYQVKFDRPTARLVYTKITVRAPLGTASVEDLVKNAVLRYSRGEMEGQPGFAVGQPISPFEIAGAVNIEAAPLFVSKVEVSFDNVTYVTTELPILINQIGFLVVGSIQVIIA